MQAACLLANLWNNLASDQESRSGAIYTCRVLLYILIDIDIRKYDLAN